jgi:hypothetical protein
MSTRNLGIVAWRDPEGDLESMRGDQWNKIIRREAAHFAAYIENPHIMLRIPAFMRSLERAHVDVINKLFGGGRQMVTIVVRGNAGIRWCLTNGKKIYDAEDIETSPDGRFIYTVEDVGAGSHLNSLSCRNSAMGRRLWTKRDVGRTVASVGARLYFLRTQKRLWANECWSCDAATGDNERLEYRETDPKYNLLLQKCGGRTLYLFGENSGYSHLRILQTDGTFTQIDTDAIYHLPCAGGTRIVLTVGGRWQVRRADGTWNLCQEPYFFDPVTELALYRRAGNVIGMLRGRKVFEYAGASVEPDTYKLWSTGSLTLIVETPTNALMTLHVKPCGIIDRQVRPQIHQRPHVHWHSGTVSSADGVTVPYGYATIRAKPRGLLVYMYGAYGSPTVPGNVLERWGPLLESGWAIGYAFVRGGGDGGWAWAEAGRRTERIRAIEDAEACVAALRRRLGVDAAHTAIYGRSAGGILMGTLANRHPAADLFGMVYAEVPYVDVLQTTTNPALPLTELEYDEFGDPANRMEDLAFWIKYSPTTNVPAGGIPDLKVLCRTGANDTQVYAYEPVKWIRLLRGSSQKVGSPKLLALKAGQGHFYTQNEQTIARAIDMAVLDHWLSHK